MARARTSLRRRPIGAAWICLTALGSCAISDSIPTSLTSDTARSTSNATTETRKLTEHQDQTRAPRRIGRLDPTQSFFYPAFTAKSTTALADTTAGPITTDTYLRYLTARFGTKYVEDLAFDIVLARECAARRIARSARVLARSSATQRFHESGRRGRSDADGSLRIKFMNEALRRLRIDALVRDERQQDERAIANLFDRRYGVGGERVAIRHVLVSFRATERRLTDAGSPSDAAAVRAAALAKARELRAKLGDGIEFATLIPESDDRTTKILLRQGRNDQAGQLPGYNYQRYGQEFATAVRQLNVGATTRPVTSSVGVHLVHLLRRDVTRLSDVRPRLVRELGMGQAKPTEIQNLRTKLLTKHGFRPTGTKRRP